MPDMRGSSLTLSRIVAIRVLLFASLAMALQAASIFITHYFDDQQLGTLMVELEANALFRGIIAQADGIRFVLPDHMVRYTRQDDAYATRIRTSEGKIIYSDCNVICDEHLLPQQVNPPDHWSRLLHRGKPISVAGGQAFDVQGQRIFIELAIVNDHELVMWKVLERAFIDDLAVPMTLMLAFLLGGTLLSLRVALRPVERAAADAENVDPLNPADRLNLEGMPREIAELGGAINRTLARVYDMMTAQRLFVAAIAHEVRTPLAMMKLELSKLDQPRARKVEAAIDDLAHLVGQLTALGRLECADRSGFAPLDLAAVGRRAVAELAPWVYDRQASIAFVEHGPVSIMGNRPLIEDAIRNLIENAVKHTPRGAAIEVSVGPTEGLTVSDDAGLLASPEQPRPEPNDGVGMGLEIVRRIMALHRGRLEAVVRAGARTSMRLVFAERGAD
jgi:signal transduction histidine kinase